MMGHAENVTGRSAGVVLLVFGLVLVTGWPAFAQPRAARPEPGRFYVLAGGFASVERFANDTKQQLNGTTVGATVGIGTFVTKRWSVELQGEIPRRLDAGLRVETSAGTAGGLVLSSETRSRITHRLDSGVVVLAFHPTRRGRVRMAYGAGVAFVRFEEHGTVDFTSTDQSSGTRTSRFVAADTTLSLVPVLHIEASVRLSRRCAFVPYLNGMVLHLDRESVAGVNYITGAGPGAFVFRPGAALRWSF